MFNSHRLIVLAAVVLVLLGLSLYFYSKKSVKGDKAIAGSNIIVFGDSLVTGQGSSPGNDFVSVLSRGVNANIVNEGLNGDTTATALTRLDGAVLQNNPKIVIVVLGGNDYLRRVPLNETIKNLEIIVEKIKAKGAAVVLVGFNPPFSNKYNSAYKVLAKEKKVWYVPKVLSGIIGDDTLMSDSIHPNDKGYAIIAERILPVLKEVLKP